MTHAAGVPAAAGASLVDWAHCALAAREEDPDRAWDLAEEVRRKAAGGRDDVAAALAYRAGALVLVDRGDVPRAVRRSVRSVEIARRCGDLLTLAGCLTTAAGLRFLAGAGEAGFALIDEACTAAMAGGDETLHADALSQRAWMLQLSGRWRAALRGVEELLDDEFTAAPNVRGRARASLLVDRACMLAQLARFEEALPAFDAAVATCREWFGNDAAEVREALRNHAICLTHAGRIPAAMRAYDELGALLAEDGPLRLRHLVGQAELLLDAGLLAEADTVTAAAIAAAGRRAPAELRGEASLLRAELLARLGDARGAAVQARRAETALTRGGKAGRAGLAARLLARLAGRSPEPLAAAAGRLADSGLLAEAASTWAEAVGRAVALGRLDLAAGYRAELAPWRRSGPALTRAEAWLAEARFLAATGHAGPAGRAVAAGLDVLDDHRASLGGTELRALASGVGEELAAFGIDLAARRGDPAAVLRISERWRAGIVLRRPRPEAEVAEALAELRDLLARLDDPDAPAESLAGASAQRAALEARVRRVARHAAGADDGGVAVLPPARQLGALLDGDSLIEYIARGDRLLAAVVSAGRTRLVDVCAIAEPVGRIRELAFALRRMARPGISPTAAGAAAASAADVLDRLSALLVAPVARFVGARVVVVPPAVLHVVPWPSLPGLAGNVVTVAPSATWWATAGAATPTSSTRRGEARVVIAAGPRLPGAVDEVKQVAGVHRSATVLGVAEATGTRLAETLDGAALVHLACHSHPRADHPHLSSFELVDGPFTVYDLERLSLAPRRVVLASCESGLGAVRPGEELLGFISALLSLGTCEVLASVVPVPDLATSALMVRFHRHVAAGTGFADAWHLARAELLADSDDPAQQAAAAAFVVYSAASASGAGRVLS